MQVLLVRRGKEPQKGMLTFPGGSLELGETMADCAIRETLEETGLRLRNERRESKLGFWTILPSGSLHISSLNICACTGKNTAEPRICRLEHFTQISAISQASRCRCSMPQQSSIMPVYLLCHHAASFMHYLLESFRE